MVNTRKRKYDEILYEHYSSHPKDANDVKDNNDKILYDSSSSSESEQEEKINKRKNVKRKSIKYDSSDDEYNDHSDDIDENGNIKDLIDYDCDEDGEYEYYIDDDDDEEDDEEEDGEYEDDEDDEDDSEQKFVPATALFFPPLFFGIDVNQPFSNETSDINSTSASKNSKTNFSRPMTKREMIEKKINDSTMKDELKQKLKQKLSKSNLDEKQIDWFETVLSIPFGKYAELPIDVNKDDVSEYFKNLVDNLDKIVYGMQDVKEEIINYIAQCLTVNTPSPRILALHGTAGVGKCLHPDTPVILYDGRVVTAKEVRVGDQLMGDDSNPRNVLTICSGTDPMYRIIQENREDYIVNEPHILTLKVVKDIDNLYKKDEIIDISVIDYMKLPSRHKKHMRGFGVECEFQEAPEVGFNPYLLGYWLGNGKENTTEIVINDVNIKQHIINLLEPYYLFIKHKNNTSKHDISNLREFKNMMEIFLETKNIYEHKRIPCDYLINSKQVRKQVLAGLLDSISDTFNHKTQYYTFTTENEYFFKDVLFLCNSLGVGVKRRNKKSCFKSTSYSCKIFGECLENLPVYSSSVKFIHNTKTEDCLLTKIKVVPVGKGQYCGFQIDGNKRFLLGDFTVTHNTKLIREGISQTLKRPLQTFSMGGIKDSNHFVGFDYTYINSRHGSILQSMIDSKVMNPILFFDELDKISSGNEGEEIENLLIHMTDPMQNYDFKDKYFSDIPIDLSKVIFIFAFNNIDNINPVLRDRLHIINIPVPSPKDKLVIAKKYVIDELLKNIGLNKEDFEITDTALEYIISKYSKQDTGIRNMKRCIESLLLKINTIKLLGKTAKKINLSFSSDNCSLPIVINENNVGKFLKSHETSEEPLKYPHLYI